MVFSSKASNLDGNDNNFTFDVFVRDLGNSTTSLHSTRISGGGSAAEFGGQNGSLDSTGRFLVFTSISNDLVPGDDNFANYDLFMKDLQDGVVTLLTTDPRGDATIRVSNQPYAPIASWSQDGNYVLFHSYSNLQEPFYSGGVVYRKNLRTGELDVVSTRIAQMPSTMGNGSSSKPTASGDGRFIAFESDANNIAPDDNGLRDIFVRDRENGTTTRVSVTSDGASANGSSEFPSITGDGRYVAFQSEGSNFVNGDNNGTTDVFVKDLQTGSLVRASTRPNGAESNGRARFAAISYSGSHVAFISDATDLVANDTNAMDDVFVKNLITGDVVRANVSTIGQQANERPLDVSISEDGRYVTFSSAASNLVPGDTNLSTDVFVKDLSTGVINLVSTGVSGSANGGSFAPSMSANGRWVSFSSDASNLVPNDTNTVRDVFLKDLQTNTIRLVSTDTTGGPADQQSDYSSVSRDGRYVSFVSRATDLVNVSIATGDSIYLKDMLTAKVFLQASRPRDPVFIELTADFSANSTVVSDDGTTVLFSSAASRFFGGDYGSHMDVFATKVGSPNNFLLDNPGRSSFTIDLKGTGFGSITEGGPVGVNGFLPSFDGYNRLFVGGVEYSGSDATLIDGGRSLQLEPDVWNATTFNREIYAPGSGAFHFVRTVDTYTNTSGSPTTVEIEHFGNTAADEKHRIFATSDGDQLLEATDTWFGTQGDAGPYIIHLLHGPFGIAPNVTVTNDNIHWSYSLPVGVGETTRIASFAIVAVTSAQAITAVNTLYNATGFNDAAVVGLTREEIDSLANFRFQSANLSMVISRSEFKEDAGSGAAVVTITRVGDLSTALTVQFSSSDTSEVSLPSSAVFPVNADIVQVYVNAIDDTILDGTQSVTLGASAIGYPSRQLAVTVLDAEFLRVTSNRASVRENAGTQAAVLTIERLNSDIGASIDVNLASSDTSEASVPSTVTIPANANSTTVFLSAIDDSIVDGTQPVVVTLSMAGYNSEVENINVLDFEQLGISFDKTAIFENAGVNAAQLTVSRPNTDRSQALTVGVSNPGWDKLSFQTAIVIPANEVSATVQVDAIDNAIRDGLVTVKVNASALGYVIGSTSIDIIDVESLDLSLDRTSFKESAATSAAYLTISRPENQRFSDLAVNLSSSDNSEVTLPATVTIPSGATFVSVALDAVDDTLLDGSQVVNIQVAAQGYDPSTATVTVLDAESITASLSKSSIAENSGAGLAILTLVRSNTDTGSAMTIQLASSDSTELTLPANVTIPANSSSVEVTVTAVDDLLLDGAQNVQLSVTASGYDGATTNMLVTDYETVSLATNVTAFREDFGANATTVTITRSNTDVASALRVTLTNPDTSEIALPASVTIPAGQTSTTFSVGAVDDTLLDGTQSIVVSASAAGYVDSNLGMSVLDAESFILTLSKSSIFENAGSNAGILRIRRTNTDLSLPLVVSLASSDNTEAILPTSVSIPANQSEVQVSLDAVDDSLLDGSQDLTLSASAAGYDSKSISLLVMDAEALAISSLVSSIREDSGNQSLRITIARSNTNVQQPLTVNVTSSLPDEIASPGEVVIPENASSIEVHLDVLDDSQLDGNQTVLLTVSSASYASADLPVNVLDVEQLSVSADRLAISENAGADSLNITVRRENSDIGKPLTVNLLSSDTTEITVPSRVTIPAGRADITFAIDVLDDTLLDGDQLVGITFSSGSYDAETLAITIVDAERLAVSLNKSTIFENAGANAVALTVRRLNTDITHSIDVPLSIDLPGIIELPTQVTIPANESQHVIMLSSIDDLILDGPQNVTITASSVGYQESSVSLLVSDYETLALTTDVAQASENGGKISMTVKRENTDWNLPVLVALSSDDSTEASVPESVTIPPGAGSAEFILTAVDDSILDGTRPVKITAIAQGYVNASTSVQITDAESLVVLIDKTVVDENAGVQAARITVRRSNTDLGKSLIVDLVSSDSSEATVPNTITIPAGSSSTFAFLSAVDDSLLDGTQVVHITATANGYISGSNSIETADAESLAMQLSLTAVPEDAGSGQVTLTVRRSNSDIAQSLDVSLSYSDSSELRGPSVVRIPADKSSIDVLLDVVDDSILDGNQSVTITATGAGYESGTGTILVTDAESLNLATSALSIAEDAGANAVTLTLSRSNSDTTSDLTVQLASTDRSEASIPASIVIPAGHASVTVPLSVIDDTLLDGNQQVELRATATGYSPGIAAIQVTDAEQILITASKLSVLESAGSKALALTVRRSNTDRNTPLTVFLNSSDTSELIVPPSVVIPTNVASVQVEIGSVDDKLLDGTQLVTIVGVATGYSSGEVGLSVADTENILLTLSRSSIRENEGLNATELTIERSNTDTSAALEVMLVSNLTGELLVPATLTIPANTSSTTVPLAAIDDTLLDGLKIGNIRGSAPGYDDGTVSIRVEDEESLQIILDVTSIAESGGRIEGTVSRSNTDNENALSVALLSNAGKRLSFPATVTIPAGQQSASFSAIGVDDRIRQGDIVFELQAIKSGYTPARANLTILDHEILETRLSQTQISEKRGTTELIVTRSDTDSSDAVLVALTVDRPDLITVPTSITIPAKQATVSLTLNTIDNFLFDGDSTLKIVATANGLQKSESTLRIVDEETKSPGTNPRNPLDVNNDQLVSPLDSLLVLNRLNLGGTVPLTESGRFYDTSGDLIVSPLDVLRVINYLNLHGSGEGEGNVEKLRVSERNPEDDIDAHHLLMGDLSWLLEDIRKRRGSY